MKYDDFITEDLKEEESIRADNEAVNREDPLKEIIWEDIKRNYRESMYNFYNSVPPEENPSWKETLYNLTIESADKAIEYLQKENEELKEENGKLKEYYKDLKKENDNLKVMIFDAAMMMGNEDCNEVE